GQVAGYSEGIAIGAPANFVLWDPTHSREFSASDLRGMSANSPFFGRALPGRVVATVHDGYPTVLDGQLVDAATVAASAQDARRLSSHTATDLENSRG